MKGRSERGRPFLFPTPFYSLKNYIRQHEFILIGLVYLKDLLRSSFWWALIHGAFCCHHLAIIQGIDRLYKMFRSKRKEL